MKMLALILAAGIFGTSASFASGWITCDLEVKVKQVEALGALDETVTWSRLDSVDTYRYIGTFEVTSSTLVRGYGECPKGDIRISLKDGKQVRVGENLKLEYRVVHDRPGNSTTYTIKK
jgi:hypothetical protein